MARYTDADCKRCRREKMKLFLKGSKCESPKCPFEKRPYPPGQHGRTRRRGTASEYSMQLAEKQKARFTYGLSANTQLDLGVNLGVTPAAENVNPFVGFSIRF